MSVSPMVAVSQSTMAARWAGVPWENITLNML